MHFEISKMMLDIVQNQVELGLFSLENNLEINVEENPASWWDKELYDSFSTGTPSLSSANQAS